MKLAHWLRPAALIWLLLGGVLILPLVMAANSPLLAWRSWIYVAGGLAGVIAMTLMLVQPLLATGTLPGVPARRGRIIHRWTGAALIAMMLIHVAGLWITSPPDVIDALLFRSPTSFSPWGVVAMWAVLATGGVAMMRRRLRIRPQIWRTVHGLAAAVIVICTVVHVLLIEGTMETWSKLALCVTLLIATFVALKKIGLVPKLPI